MPTLREHIQKALRDLEVPGQDDYQENWRAGFLIARRLQRALLEANVAYEDMAVDLFEDQVREVADVFEWDADELVMAVCDAWPKVRCPEDQDALTLAFNLVLQCDDLEPLSSEFPTEKATEHAAIIATVAAELQDNSDMGTLYLPVRRVGEILSRSPQYVAQIIRQLVEDGTLKKVTDHTAKRSTRYQYVPQPERVPTRVDRGSRRFRRSRRSRGIIGDAQLDLDSTGHKSLEGKRAPVASSRSQGYLRETLDTPVRVSDIIVPKRDPEHQEKPVDTEDREAIKTRLRDEFLKARDQARQDRERGENQDPSPLYVRGLLQGLGANADDPDAVAAITGSVGKARLVHEKMDAEPLKLSTNDLFVTVYAAALEIAGRGEALSASELGKYVDVAASMRVVEARRERDARAG